MEKDFYSILELTDEDKKLSSDEFNKKLKSNFRKLSLKWHPDKFSGKSESEKKNAEEKFKEISEAYNTLSDSNKRQEYDMSQGGFGGFNPFGDDFNPFGSHFNPFGDDFNPFGRHSRGGQTQMFIPGEDIKIDVYLNIKEIYTGGKKTVKYNKKVKCTHCNGTGSEDGKNCECTNCNGTGRVRKTSRNGMMTMIQEGICPECNGTGKKIMHKCSHCGGTGLENQESSITFDFPKGIMEGMMMKKSGLGCESVNGGPSGSLIIVFHELSDEIYERKENDIIMDLDLTLSEALLGCDKEINCIDGKTLKIKVKPLTRDKDMLKLDGRGMPIMNTYYYGNLYLEINYILPTSLSERQKELLKEFDKN